MVLYRYRAKAADGDFAEGTLEAGGLREAMHELSEKHLKVVSLAKVPPESGSWGRKVDDAELSRVSRKLASLTDMGAPLAHSLTVITSELRNPRLQESLNKVRQDLESGHPLSKAMGAFPDLFPPFTLRMIDAGEKSGTLPHMLYRMSDIWQKRAQFRARVRSILIYPFCILVVVLLFATVFRLWLFPQMLRLYPDPTNTPAVTWIFLRCLDLTIIGTPLVGIGLCVLWRLRKTSYSTRLSLSKLAFKIPIVSSLNREVVAARFSRTFGMLLRGGLEPSEAMRLSARVVGNTHAERELEEAAEMVGTGHPISEALERTNVVPRDLVLAVSLSEDRGSISQDLLEVADNHDATVENRLDSILAFLEPAVLMIMGLFVALCALSGWLPYLLMIPAARSVGGPF